MAEELESISPIIHCIAQKHVTKYSTVNASIRILILHMQRPKLGQSDHYAGGCVGI